MGVERSTLIDAYWQHYRLSISELRAQRSGADTHAWAEDEVERAVGNADDGVIGLLVALADAATNDGELAYLGAGPVEELLQHHAARFVDEVEAAARAHPAFRTALRCAWYDDDVPSNLVARLRRFGEPL
jgi:hypothetical protein